MKTKAKMRLKMESFCNYVNFMWPRGAIGGQLSFT